jgi:hypothetical protein
MLNVMVKKIMLGRPKSENTKETLLPSRDVSHKNVNEKKGDNLFPWKLEGRVSRELAGSQKWYQSTGFLKGRVGGVVFDQIV